MTADKQLNFFSHLCSTRFLWVLLLAALQVLTMQAAAAESLTAIVVLPGGAAVRERPIAGASETGWLACGTSVRLIVPEARLKEQKVDWFELAPEFSGSPKVASEQRWLESRAVLVFLEDLPNVRSRWLLRQAGTRVATRTLPESLVQHLTQPDSVIERQVRQFVDTVGLEDTFVFTGDDKTSFQGVHSVLAAELDAEPGPEYLLLLGTGCPWFCVLKKFDTAYRLLHLEYLDWWEYSGRPTMQLHASGGANKLFSILRLHDKGTGIYDVRHHFYRLIQGGVVPVLVLPAEVRCFWIGMPLHTEVTTSFFPAEPDGLSVRYRYRCFAFENWSDDLPFFETNIDILYKWSEQKRQLVPEFESGEGSADKLECLTGDFPRPDRFLRAFAQEAGELERRGTVRQRLAIRRLRQWCEKGE